ncbi:hypothetical protein M569_01457, partial [Genlisea aurea]
HHVTHPPREERGSTNCEPHNDASNDESITSPRSDDADENRSDEPQQIVVGEIPISVSPSIERFNESRPDIVISAPENPTVPRRSEREKRAPKYLDDFVCHTA